MEKNKALLILFSFIPGAGQMYLNMMKKGITIMLVFWGAMGLSAILRFEVLLFLLPVLWFYSFFDTHNSKWLTNAEIKTTDDNFLDGIAFPKLMGTFNDLDAKGPRFLGIGLILTGGYILLMNFVQPLIYDIVYYVNPDANFNIIHSFFNSIPTFVVSLLIIVLGIKLIKGNRVTADKDFIEYKGDKNEK